MKVVLTRDVKGIGRAHETVEAKNGHALNFLIPQKLAVLATAGAVKQAEGKRALAAAKHEVADKLVLERLAALADGRVVVKKKTNEQGHLYDALDAKELAEAAQLPESAVKLEKPLKELGTFQVPVAAGKAFGEITVAIEAE